MDKDLAMQAAEALDFLDTYQSPKVKQAVETLRESFGDILERALKEDRMKRNNLKYSYKMFEPLVRAEQVVTTLNSAINYYNEASTNLEKTHKSTQDILHAIELLDLDEEEMVQYARDLHEIRAIRREAKDFTEIILPLYDLACKHQHIVKEFIQAQAEMKKIIAQKENRKYTPREKHDLAERFEKIAQ